MKYDEYLQVLSPARLNKYAQASGNEKAKTLRLYQYNIKLSQRFYGVIGMFEIMLRNAINAHYKQYFNDDNWIINQASPNGLLEQEAAEIERIQRTYTNMGATPDEKRFSVRVLSRCLRPSHGESFFRQGTSRIVAST